MTTALRTTAADLADALRRIAAGPHSAVRRAEECCREIDERFFDEPDPPPSEAQLRAEDEREAEDNEAWFLPEDEEVQAGRHSGVEA